MMIAAAATETRPTCPKTSHQSNSSPKPWQLPDEPFLGKTRGLRNERPQLDKAELRYHRTCTRICKNWQCTPQQIMPDSLKLSTPFTFKLLASLAQLSSHSKLDRAYAHGLLTAQVTNRTRKNSETEVHEHMIAKHMPRSPRSVEESLRKPFDGLTNADLREAYKIALKQKQISHTSRDHNVTSSVAEEVVSKRWEKKIITSKQKQEERKLRRNNSEQVRKGAQENWRAPTVQDASERGVFDTLATKTSRLQLSEFPGVHALESRKFAAPQQKLDRHEQCKVAIQQDAMQAQEPVNLLTKKDKKRQEKLTASLVRLTLNDEAKSRKKMKAARRAAEGPKKYSASNGRSHRTVGWLALACNWLPSERLDFNALPVLSAEKGVDSLPFERFDSRSLTPLPDHRP